MATNKRRQRTQTAGSGIYREGRPTRRFGAWWEGKAEATLAEATVGVAAEGRVQRARANCHVTAKVKPPRRWGHGGEVGKRTSHT